MSCRALHAGAREAMSIAQAASAPPSEQREAGDVPK
jgi:hypothetical protein